ncbi:MAG: 5-(carboxyamino)imidazole ribonucleotide mutase [Dethiobacter sp.]|jgi:5-(carboxyamino)imidazole ribonucleotide mutase|nr:5-(carboxyamino)imidazole ribonucleotide mutase [Dethiobacter sp.]MBS3902067.1 5-(carboxyamino)imidazole ribonucleotide mutase [Dethiobacter sp.]MBS3988910.1 5-(carboxyamino)imidazole ribonucleotide mutase [Dethiobacter sp.]
MAEEPTVGIIMGSDSDLAVMSGAAEILAEFGVPYELTVVSAHRTPERLFRYAAEAAARGLKVIVAGAGGAAHLPGMVAAVTELPVIGVPVKTAALGGVDSLYSIVQMPPGVPVAAVAINGGKNAGLLAVQILAVADRKLLTKMAAYKKNLCRMVEEKATVLEEAGWQVYLARMLETAGSENNNGGKR